MVVRSPCGREHIYHCGAASLDLITIDVLRHRGNCARCRSGHEPTLCPRDGLIPMIASVGSGTMPRFGSRSSSVDHSRSPPKPQKSLAMHDSGQIMLYELCDKLAATRMGGGCDAQRVRDSGGPDAARHRRDPAAPNIPPWSLQRSSQHCPRGRRRRSRLGVSFRERRSPRPPLRSPIPQSWHWHTNHESITRRQSRTHWLGFRGHFTFTSLQA